MKKILTVGFSLILTACACKTTETQIVPEPINAVPMGYSQVNVQVKTATPYAYGVVNPCCCPYRPNPCREVIRPRIKEIVVTKTRRNCPPDSQMINCGCGNCPTFKQPVIYQQFNTIPATSSVKIPTTKTLVSHTSPRSQNVNVPTFSADGYVITDMETTRDIIPIMPDAYILASNRAANRFLKDAPSMVKGSSPKTLYVKTGQLQSRDLPGGIEQGVANFKRQINNGYIFELADTLSGADYYVETRADWLDTASKTIPAIQYKTSLYDKNNNKINEWIEVIKKPDNAQSWI